MTTPNTELLNKTLDHIKAHPEEWNQIYWVTQFGTPTRSVQDCGTAYCFAGHAVLIAGYEIRPDLEVFLRDLPEDVQARIPRRGVTRSSWDGEALVTDVAHAACALLGIPDYYSTSDPHLFDGDNELEDLERFVAELCDETVKAGA